MNFFCNISSTAARALALELSSRRRPKSSHLPHPTFTTRLLRVHPPTWPIPTQTHCEPQPQRIQPSLTYIGSTAYISVLCETDVRENLTQLKQDILDNKEVKQIIITSQNRELRESEGKMLLIHDSTLHGLIMSLIIQAGLSIYKVSFTLHSDDSELISDTALQP